MSSNAESLPWAPDRARRIERAFFARATDRVARALIGCVLVHDGLDGLTAGRVVEVEAYGDVTDLASHAAFLKNGGVRSMSGEAGIAYVYRSYGIHAMFNIVAKPPASTGAILVRALDPLAGIDLMIARRSRSPVHRLCAGPGNLCQAMDIRLEDHGTDLIESPRLWLQHGDPPAAIGVGTRIGITRAADTAWRFFDPASRSVSGHRRGTIEALPFQDIDS